MTSIPACTRWDFSETDYIGTEISYYQAKSSYESADTALRLAIETYDWGVQGLATVE